MKIERISHGIAKKWEFIYYRDWVNDRTKYPLREGKSYSIVYYIDKNEVYVDSKQRVLIIVKNLTNYSKYKKLAQNFKRESYLTTYLPYIKKDSKAKEISRFFAKYNLEPATSPFEISSDSFSKESTLYDKVGLLWRIRGEVEEVKKFNLKSIENTNVTWLKNTLDLLEFYKGDIETNLTLKEMTMKRLEKLLHNQHSYTTKQEALNVAGALGLSGVHQMSNGNWMPGSSHQAYQSLL